MNYIGLISQNASHLYSDTAKGGVHVSHCLLKSHQDFLTGRNV